MWQKEESSHSSYRQEQGGRRGLMDDRKIRRGHMADIYRRDFSRRI